MSDIDLSIVVLAWDQLDYTTACVESLRAHTDVPYELIIVDNGSAGPAADYATNHGDKAILNAENRGFAPGMNQGLAVAEGGCIVFANNDTVFPPGWASPLLEVLGNPRVGICVPAVTAAGNPVTVRSVADDHTTTLDPFAELPSGVVYAMRTGLAREIGGWNEHYPIASAEDLDLAFTVWTNDLDIVFDERVLVEHVSRGTVKAKLPDRQQLYRDNLHRFFDRWIGDDEIIRLADCDPQIHVRNRQAARAAAIWLRRLIEERDVSRELRSQISVKKKRFGR